MTAVVRELVTRLSFVFDRTNLDRFERAISGFKFRFSAISAAVGFFGNKVLNKFQEIAKATLDTDELARSTRTATEDFIALQKAADQFRIDPDAFSNAFKGLSDSLSEARRGTGKLYDILGKSVYQLNLLPFANSHNITGAMKRIFEYVAGIKDVTVQLDILKDAFGENAANGFLNVINAGNDALFRGAEANRAYARSVVENKESLTQYEKDLKTFYTHLETLTQSVVKILLPLLTPIVQGLAGIFSGESFTEKGYAKLHENDSERLAKINRLAVDTRADFGLPESGFNLKKWLGFAGNFNPGVSVLDEDSPARRYYESIADKKQQAGWGNATITNNFEIAVPVGSPDGEANRIAELIKLSIENTFIEKSREIISNNPAVE